MLPNSTSIIEEKVNGEYTNTKKEEYKLQILYSKVFILLFLHLCFIYGLYLSFTSADIRTVLFEWLIIGNITSLGLTAGAHRLWSHRSYKAKLPLRIFLCICNSVSSQTDIYDWCRDHRVHHKYTETDADPHNIQRGFFFAHMGWLMCRKHPDVKAKGKNVSLDDLWADPVVRFQKRFHIPMSLFFSFYLPTMIPVWFWNETVLNSFFAAMVRYCIGLHITWSVNSAAHKFGDRPFDKHIHASDNPFVSFFAFGEGWHNYHHVFPWDYATSELGYTMNMAKVFIDFMAKIGQAYDLKSADSQMIESRKLKTGDGTRQKSID